MPQRIMAASGVVIVYLGTVSSAAESIFTPSYFMARESRLRRRALGGIVCLR